jgi:carbon monoxide dehydrogenase subunit G
MHFENTVTVKAPLEKILDFYEDHEKLFPCIKGFKKVEVIEPKSRYTFYVMEKVGPFKVNFAIDLEIKEIEASKHFQFRATGKDSKIAASFRQHGDVTVKNSSDNETELRFTTDVSIFGKLGTLGHWLIKKKADEAMDHFVRSMRVQLEEGGGV